MSQDPTPKKPPLSEAQLAVFSLLAAIGLIASLFMSDRVFSVVFVGMLASFKTVSFYYYEKKWDLLFMSIYTIATMILAFMPNL